MLNLDAIEARARAATPGPWSQGMVGNKLLPEVDYSAAFGFIVVNYRTDDGQHGVADADFIAHARTDIPALVAELRAAREVVEAAQDAHTMRGRFVRCGLGNCRVCAALAAYRAVVGPE